MQDGKTKFIRVRGKVIPIRADKGYDMRGSQRGKLKQLNNKERRKVFNEAASKTRQPGAASRAKEGVGLAVLASGVFGGFGAAAGAATGGTIGAVGSKLGKFSKGAAGRMAGKLGIAGAAAGVALGIAGGISSAFSKQKVANNRQYNKAYGKALAKKNSTGF